MEINARWSSKKFEVATKKSFLVHEAKKKRISLKTTHEVYVCLLEDNVI